MSVPNEFDFAVIKIGDGAGPEVFTISCGKSDVTINFVANSNDRFVRDCAKPGEIPFRSTTVTGKQCDVTASGLTDKAQFGVEHALLGKRANARVEFMKDDGSDAGVLMGTVAGNFRVLSINVGAPREDTSNVELTLASHGSWTYTAAA
jgi:hypothetical protein